MTSLHLWNDRGSSIDICEASLYICSKRDGVILRVEAGLTGFPGSLISLCLLFPLFFHTLLEIIHLLVSCRPSSKHDHRGFLQSLVPTSLLRTEMSSVLRDDTVTGSSS